MPTHRKTILVIHPPAKDPAGISRLLADMGHTAVTVAQEKAALNLLGTVRFDVINEGGAGAANEAGHADCDATIAEPWSPSRVQWVFDFELRYFDHSQARSARCRQFLQLP